MAEPVSDEEFKALWSDLHRSSRDVADRLGISIRGANKRARGLGLPPKNLRPERTLQLRARLMAAASGPTAPPAWLTDPQIAPVAKEIEAALVAARTSEDLVRIWPFLMKFSMLGALKHPDEAASWRSFSSLAKETLLCRRIEADMPPSADRVVLRQEAARQMMAEVASVLNQEEQRDLGHMLQMASDRLMARKKGQVVPEEESPARLVAAYDVASREGAPW